MNDLYAAVSELAHVTHSLADSDLDQPWSWRAHDEGARFALIGTYHELRDLAALLCAERASLGTGPTLIQIALGQLHGAYRDFQALLVGVPDATYDADPGPGEWPLRTVVAHIVGAERRFFTLIDYGLRRRRSGDAMPLEPPDDEADRIVGPYDDYRRLWREAPPADVLSAYDDLHRRALTEFAAITDEESAAPTWWWENDELDLRYRIHRADAHLRQHTVQMGKVLEATDNGPTEARRWLRLVYGALADVESVTIGAPDLGAAETARLAQQIADRARDVAAAIERGHAVAAAAAAGDLTAIGRLTKDHPQSANARSAQGLSAVMTAIYHGHRPVADALAEAGAELTPFEAAAMGRLDLLQEWATEWPELVGEFSRDGFSPLHLAAFFGNEETAVWLIDNGANPNTRARNSLAVQPLHSAAAGGHVGIVRALLEGGADPNARQQRGFTPLHAAAESGNLEMARLLVGAGADPAIADDDGGTPADLARKSGHEQLAVLLDPR